MATLRLKRRRRFQGVVALLLLSLAWGYVRLPYAAVRSLDFSETKPVRFNPPLEISPVQKWYLGLAIRESRVPVVPSVSVNVRWNAILLARVESNCYVGPRGAEDRDSLYLWVLGAWFPIYDFRHGIA